MYEYIIFIQPVDKWVLMLAPVSTYMIPRIPGNGVLTVPLDLNPGITTRSIPNPAVEIK